MTDHTAEEIITEAATEAHPTTSWAEPKPDYCVQPPSGFGMQREKDGSFTFFGGGGFKLSGVEFRDDVTVQLIKHSASDRDVLFAARVSTAVDKSLADAALDDDKELEAKDLGLINYLMRDRHGSPFEHSSMTFFVQAPIFVFREFMRHRIASYNEESGRYSKLKSAFYRPARDRNLVQQGKPGAYTYVPGSDEQWELVQRETSLADLTAYIGYQKLLDAGVAREVARIALPLNLYSSMYVTMNVRALMNFLSLRVKSDISTFPSFPQREIEMCAEIMEREFARLMPVTYAAFIKNGRVAP